MSKWKDEPTKPTAAIAADPPALPHTLESSAIAAMHALLVRGTVAQSAIPRQAVELAQQLMRELACVSA